MLGLLKMELPKEMTGGSLVVPASSSLIVPS
jgi:hypothetical protein